MALKPSANNNLDAEELRRLAYMLITQAKDSADIISRTKQAVPLLLGRRGDAPLIVQVGEVIDKLDSNGPVEQTRKNAREILDSIIENRLTRAQEEALARSQGTGEGEIIKKQQDQIPQEYRTEDENHTLPDPKEDSRKIPLALNHQTGKYSGSNLPDAPIPIVSPRLSILRKYSECPDGMEEFIKESIVYQISERLQFFQSRHTGFDRGVLPPYFLSPEFAKRFVMVAEKYIIPYIIKGMGKLMHDSRVDWKNMDTRSFWEQISIKYKDEVTLHWRERWKQIFENTKKHGGRVAWKHPDVVRDIRKIFDSEEYLINRRKDNHEVFIGIDHAIFFGSLFDPEFHPGSLTETWRGLTHNYEQELDPRVYSAPGREGQFRDALIETINNRGVVGEYMAILAYLCFPNFNSDLFENFGTIYFRGENEVPVLSWFLQESIATEKDT